MSTKTYKADTLQKVLEIIRQELGPDALILSSTRNEFDGKVEVAATLQQHTETDGFIVSDPRGAILDSHSLIDELFQQDLSRKRRRDQIKTLQSQLHGVMVSLGVDPSTTTDLISQLDSYTASDDLVRADLRAELIARLAHVLSTNIRITSIAPEPTADTQWLVFSGLTASGVSTIITKLAVQWHLRQHLPVAVWSFCTDDKSSMLQDNCTSAGIPFIQSSDVFEAESWANSLRRGTTVLTDFGVNLNQGDVRMREFTKLAGHLDVALHTVLDVTRHPRITSEFLQLQCDHQPKSILLTHCDEANAWGHIISELVRLDTPLSVLSTGQRIPDDHQLASAQWLAHKFVKEIREGFQFSDSLPGNAKQNT